MAGRRTKTRYSTPSGYTYSRNKYEQLQRAVRNYNRRITNLENKTDNLLHSALPDKLSFTSVRDRFTSTKQVNEFINRLNMYKREGLELVENPYGTGLVTRAAVEVSEREASMENRRRKRALRMATRGAEEYGRLPTDQSAQLRPVSPSLYIGTRNDPAAMLMEGRNIDDRTVAWQERYIGMLKQIRGDLLIMGRATDQNLAWLDEIERIVSGMSAYAYYYAQLVFPVVSISITSDAVEFEKGIEEIYETWRDFANTL